MRSGLSREKRLHKLPGEHSLEHGGSRLPYCLRSFKRHKVSASPQFHANIGAIAGELHGTCNAEVTTVEMELLRVLGKVELHNVGSNSFIPKNINILCCSDTSSMPRVHPRKYPPPKFRKGVTVFREFPQGCGRRNLDLLSKSDVKISKEKQMMFEVEKEQIKGGSCKVGSGFARKAEGKILEHIDDKVTAESELATQADKAELLEKVYYSECKFNQEASIDTITAESELATQADKAELLEKVCYSECKFNQEASIDTITIASSPPSNSQVHVSSKMTSNNDDGVKSWMGRNGNDPDEYSRYKLADVNNSVVMHSVNNEYNDVAHLDGGKSVGQQGVKISVFAAATGATDGYGDKTYELMGHKGSYYLLLKHNDAKFDDGESATRMGVTTSEYEAATVGTDGFRDNMYELMGHKGSYYLLLKPDDTNFHVSYVENDVHIVEAGIDNAEAVSDRKDSSTDIGKPSINLTVNYNQEALCRSKVRGVLNLFQKTLKERLLEKQVTRKSKGKTKMISSHIYEEVAMLLMQQKEWVYMNERVLGTIPGVEVGDQFQYRAELVIVGVHVQFVADIDYMEKDSKKIATSIVSTRFYSDDEDLTNVIYIFEDGNETMAEQNLEDQTLVQGKLALKNSLDEESPVRVIRGHQTSEGRSTTYTYDGLYIVSKFWQERGQNGKLVYMFQLNKMQGQPKLKVNKLGRYGKSKARFYRTLIDDISYGKEKVSIPVVNDIDNDKPPTFRYINKMVYPQLRKSANARGCRCIDGCSDNVQCSCVVKNGGTVPFNEDGALVKAKPIVHECGPSCKCPPSCMNRVSQHGLKIQLEVFKTKMRGWGIRSRNFISSGSFICEYVGELLDDKQAEERIGFDEYLFDIGDEDGFAIDAAKIGSVGRFVNHSCSPNLYAQDVLFDHDDKMMPHVMLFATRNIHPLQELTYDYNYKVGHISDSNGNVKEKACHCGARKCSGRMY